MDRDPEPARLQIRLFQRPVHEEPVAPAVALRLDVGGLGGEQYRATTAGSTGAPLEILDVDADVASLRQRAADQAGAVREVEAERCRGAAISGRPCGPSRQLPRGRRDAERPADQLARHHAAEQEHASVGVEAVAVEARPLVAAAATRAREPPPARSDDSADVCAYQTRHVVGGRA